jgi:hypothetical protein
MQKIDLSKYTRTYHHDRDIETAIAWSTTKKYLEEIGKGELFVWIQSIHITEKTIAITTQKPVVNTELHLYRETLAERISESISSVMGTKIMRRVLLK